MRVNTEFKEAKGIGKIPADWKVKELGEITDINVGYVGSINDYYTEDKAEGVILLRTGNISRNGLLMNDIKYVTREFHNKNKKSKISGGDLIISRHGDSGSATMIPYNVGECNCLNVVVIRKSNKFNSMYMQYLFNTRFINNELTKTRAGSVQGVINTKEIITMKVIIPTLEEQEKISQILSNVDMNIEKTEQAIAKYKQVKKGLMDDLLTGKVRIKDEKRFRETNFKDVKGVGKIPWDWEAGAYSELAVINPSKNICNLTKFDMVSFIRMEDTSEETRIKKMTNKKLKEVEKGYTYFSDNDILFAKITPCLENGKGGIAKGLTNRTGFGSTEFHVLRPKNSKSINFLYHHSKSERMRGKAASLMIGSAGQQRIQKDFFYEYIIGIPNEDEQLEIGKILNYQDEVIEKEEKYLEKLKKLKSGLMEDLLTGKVRVDID